MRPSKFSQTRLSWRLLLSATVVTVVAVYGFGVADSQRAAAATTAAILSAICIGLVRQRHRTRDASALAPIEVSAHPIPTTDERISLLFNASPVAIMLVRVNDGQIVDVNAAFTELWKYTRTEALGRTSIDLALWIEPSQLIQQLKENRYSDAHELQIRRKSGEARAVLASVSMLQIDGSAHLLITAVDVTERNRSRHLEHVANHDTLTELPNRLRLLSHLGEVRERTLEAGALSAVLFLDLDRFKAVNDSCGHRAGDELLRLVAARLQGRMRSTDLVARLGGDEFVIVLEDIRERQQAMAIGLDIVRQISTPFAVSGGRQVEIGVSIGIAYFSVDCPDVDVLIQRADEALYAAKSGGRNQVRVFGVPNRAALGPASASAAE